MLQESVAQDIETLECVPNAFWSWTYNVRGSKNGDARLTFETYREQGTIVVSGMEFTIRKHGWLSGLWTLEQNGLTLATAHKPSALTRVFEVDADDRRLELKARLMSRTFDLFEDNYPIGVVRPAHMFTRRAWIDCPESVPFLVRLFCFWLAALMWRRQNKNSKSA